MNKKTKMKGKQTGKQATLDGDALYKSAMAHLYELDLYVDGYLDKQQALERIETLRQYFRAYDLLLCAKLKEPERVNTNGQ